MTTLMLSILAVWFVAIFLGPQLWLASPQLTGNRTSAGS